MTGKLEAAQPEKLQQMTDGKALRGWIEPAIQGHLLFIEDAGEFGVGDLMHKPPPLKLREKPWFQCVHRLPSDLSSLRQTKGLSMPGLDLNYRQMSVRRPTRFGSLLLTITLVLGACATDRKVEEDALAPKTESTKIFAADGTLITTLRQEENREILPIDEIPRHVRDAVVAIEDARFYTHKGVDLKAILRALYANASSGKVVEGGSTITQQLVRNALTDVGKEQTLERKVKEAQYAYNVDQKYAKEKILELYINTVYFGDGAYGIQTASQTFFNKDVQKLTLPEGALLAGLIRSPVNYNPRTNADAALARRNRVLDRMFLNKFISASETSTAKGTELGIAEKIEASKYLAPYFVDYITRQIQKSEEFKDLGDTEQARGDTLFRKGLRIYTTVDLKMQKAAEDAMSVVLDNPDVDPSGAMAAIDPKNGHVKALIGGRDYFASQEQDPCVKVGAVNADGSPKTCAKVNLAIGQGGGGTGRQSGSAFKPFVLASALEKGIRLTDVYSAPSCIDIAEADAGGTRPWHVCNYEDASFGGATTVREATYKSINTVYAQLIPKIGESLATRRLKAPEAGAKAVVETAEKMGICETTTPILAKGRECKMSAVPSAALGANAVSPLDMASAFSTFPMLGVHNETVSITKITDARGNILWRPVEEKTQAINPGVAHLATTAMEDVISKGTGARFGKIGRPAFGKTGTAQEWRDAWFVGGAGTDLVAAVAVFWPDGEIEMKPSCTGRRTGYVIEQTASGPVARPPECRQTRIRVAGGTWPTLIWQNFMLRALEGIPASTFPVPEVSVVQIEVDSTRGCLPNPYTPKELIEQQSFIKGTEPTEVCAEPTGPVGALVPKVIGFPEGEAIRLLDQAGFAVARQFEPTSVYPPGRVVRQSPEGGTGSPAGSTVTIWVSVEVKMLTVPDLKGMTEKQAREKLKDVGFTESPNVRYQGQCKSGTRDCRVQGQDPLPGEKVPENRVITIFMGPA